MITAASQSVATQPSTAHELVLTPSRGMPRTLNMEAMFGAVTAWVVIGEGVMVTFARADLDRVCVHTSADRSNVYLDGAVFKLTVAELPLVEALLSALGELTTAISGLDQGDIWNDRCQIAWETARVAIANAEKAS